MTTACREKVLKCIVCVMAKKFKFQKYGYDGLTDRRTSTHDGLSDRSDKVLHTSVCENFVVLVAYEDILENFDSSSIEIS